MEDVGESLDKSPEVVELCVEEPSTSKDPSKSSKPRKSRRAKVYKELPQNQCPSVCLICRHPAAGHHYGSGMDPLAIKAEVKCDEGEALRARIVEKRATFDNRLSFLSFEDKVSRVIDRLMAVETKLEGVHNNGMPIGFQDVRDLRTVLASKVIYDNTKIPAMSYQPVKCSKHTGLPKRRSRNFVHASCLASIEYSKTFDFANALEMDAKVVLMKHVTLMCANLTNAFTTFAKLKSDRLVYPDGTVYGPPARKMGPLVEKQRAFLQSTLRALMRNNVNETEYVLLKAIVVCNPAVPDLCSDDAKHLQKEREIYAHCLFRYCLTRHGSVDGPSRFVTLLAIFHVFENQQKEQKDLYVYVKAVHALKHKDPDELSRKRISVLHDQIMD
ncbi:unnamed protein product [Caenorhabditis sp. 36 PRJEB53466]|nr:unnamed protein product [Caenorhabditis sp. 36 PRJEB53466]